MARCIGIIENTNGWFNFYPNYSIKNGVWERLTETDLERLLPNSYYKNIALWYEHANNENLLFMERNFPTNALYCLEFETEELDTTEDNRFSTRYQINARIARQKKLNPIHTNHNYLVLEEDDCDNILNEICFVNHEALHDGCEVLVEGEKKHLYGPYIVKLDENNNYYIKPGIKQNQYIVEGYTVEENAHIQKYVFGYKQVILDLRIAFVEDAFAINSFDVIDERILLSSLMSALPTTVVQDADSKIEIMERMLVKYKNDLFKDIPEDMRTSRFNTLKRIFASEETYSKIQSGLAPVVANVFVNNNNNPEIQSAFEALLDYPGFEAFILKSDAAERRLERINNEYEQVKSSVDALKNEAVRLQSRKESLQKELEQKRQENKNKLEIEFFEQHKEKEEELKRLVEKIGIAQNIVSLKETNAMLKNDNEQLTFENEALEKAKTTLAEDIANYSESLGKTIANSRFDSMITSKVFDVMSDYDKQQEEQSYYSIQKLLASIESVSLEPNELTNYLCGAVRRARPRYDENTIINIAICITQGFLTFFSGEPGCGKTSICNIMGSAFGAKGFDCYGTSAISASRFVAISVQRGWTTQKDLIGYYNPLTKTYDKSNQKLYDALKILDIEKRQDEEKFPCLVLLDEANLSPMEYYWADFMNVCDGIDEGSEIDLGNGNVLGVPNNLRFLATANSDFTTENLSPRLIDRAWVITLPKTQFAGEDDLRLDEIQKLSWASLWDAYGKPQEHVCFQEDQSEVFNELKKLFKEQYFDVSYRTQRSMEDYCYVAQKYMTNDQYDRDSTVVAMDYAVAQKLLPKIKGSGHEFKKWLQDVAELCKTYSLIISADLINAIIQKGDKRMSYYSFF